jgi:hypothetical protein
MAGADWIRALTSDVLPVPAYPLSTKVAEGSASYRKSTIASQADNWLPVGWWGKCDNMYLTAEFKTVMEQE